MTKRYLIIPLSLLLTFATVLPALALEGRASTTRATSTEDRMERMEDRREDMEERRGELKTRIEERHVEMRERRIEFQQSMAERKVEHTKRVILATIERLRGIITRIESRIAKLEERGIDTTEATNFVNLAKDNLDDAEAAVNNFPTDFSSESAQDNFSLIRAAASVAKDYIRTAHTNLKDAVRVLKAGNGESENNSNVSSTESN